MKYFCRFILLSIAAILLLNSILLVFISNINSGIIATFVLGLLLIGYAFSYKTVHSLLNKKFGRVIKALLFIILIGVTFLTTLISVAGVVDTVAFNEEAVIVLGAGIQQDKPSRPLIKRLDTAVTYHRLNPSAFIVLSGGCGTDERYSEAEVMEGYLLERGVNPEKIIKEEHSTSTYENFVFSKRELDKVLSRGYRVAFITNSFHTYRAGRVAKTAGLKATRMHAQNDLITIIPNYIRECFAIPFYWVMGR